jgi:hypothetical protein
MPTVVEPTDPGTTRGDVGTVTTGSPHPIAQPERAATSSPAP